MVIYNSSFLGSWQRCCFYGGLSPRFCWIQTSLFPFFATILVSNIYKPEGQILLVSERKAFKKYHCLTWSWVESSTRGTYSWPHSTRQCEHAFWQVHRASSVQHTYAQVVFSKPRHGLTKCWTLFDISQKGLLSSQTQDYTHKRSKLVSKWGQTLE